LAGGRALMGIRRRLERLEVREPASGSPVSSPRVRDFLDRLAAWKRAGSPDTEEGRELQALSEAFEKRHSEQLRGEGRS
jgi:hypothetical protein